MTRVSTSQRIKLQCRAEREIMRYANDHMLFHKHIHGVTLDPLQLLKSIEMDAHRNTVDYSARRTGKTFLKEIFNLKHLATNAHETLGIVAPREKQALIGLSYHLDAIRRSEILKAYLGVNRGRVSWSDTRYTFANGSGAEVFGIMANIDGSSLTIASLDEVDDMDYERLVTRFLPMLGASRRAGVDRVMSPQVRISGVLKGADTLTDLIKTGNYHVLPKVDVYMGMELGTLDKVWAEEQRIQNPESSWLGQFLCMDVAATNFIWDKYIRKAIQVGLSARLDIADPVPGARYKKRGLISFGLDWSGHGTSATASKSAFVVCEQIGNFVTFPFVRTWPAGTDDRVVVNDLLGLWEYFRPDYAMGDAFGVGSLTELNDRLYARGLTDIDRRTIGDGNSTASTWQQWAFAPIRFAGHVKHSMASSLRSLFHNSQAAIPSFDEDDAECADWLAFVRQLGNIKAEATKADYLSYKMVSEKIGDDLFDAACAGVWALVTRGMEEVATVIGTRTQTREQLMGLPARLAA